MIYKFRFSLFLGVTGILCGCQGPGPQDSSAPAAAKSDSTDSIHASTAGATSAASDPFVSLNKLFLEGYRERQAVVKSTTSPLIVADFGSLILIWNGLTETNRSIPDIYQGLKAVAHVPFGIFLQVGAYANDSAATVPEVVLTKLRMYRERITAAEASLPQADFPAGQLPRQREILKASKLYLTKVISTGRAPREELLSFARNVGPLMLENAKDAAVAQLRMTHAAVMQWKKQIPAEEWKRLVVVVRGPQMPRRMNILTQYFAKVLGEPSHNLGYPLESRRLIYAESIAKDRDPLDLVATTMIDGDASEAFFGDHWRMSRDLLADGAEEYLQRLSFE